MDREIDSNLSFDARRIVAACLLNAYRDAWKPVLNGREKHTREVVIQTTREWFISKSQQSWSFEWLCAVLDLEPTIIRQQVLTEWRRFKLTSQQS